MEQADDALEPNLEQAGETREPNLEQAGEAQEPAMQQLEAPSSPASQRSLAELFCLDVFISRFFPFSSTEDETNDDFKTT